MLTWFIGDLQFKPASGATEVFEMNRAPCHQRQPTQDLHSGAKKYVYFCRHFTETSNFINMSSRLQTRALIVLKKLSRTETRITKRLFFPFYQK